jgi:two-component system NtrC family sensor kinase
VPLRSLSTRIAIPAGFFALVSVAVLAFVLIRAQREQVLNEVVHGSESVSEAILLSLDHDMRQNRRERIQELVETLGRHDNIERIRLFNKDGRISYSSLPAEVGRSVDAESEACVHCHGGRAVPVSDLDPRNRSRLYTNGDGTRLLGTIHVIRNQPGCQGARCHVSAAEQKVLGVLDVSTSLEPAWARLGTATRNAVLLSLAAVALITGTLILMIRRSVRRPLNLMAAATRHVAAGEGPSRAAAGDPSLAIPPGSAREIQILAESFNEMLESLASSNQRLEEWAGSLQQNVAAKARELAEARTQIVQAEKLSSVGLVAAGIAHELNSPLMAILTFAHLVKGSLPPDSQAQEDVRMIERETNRCAAIIRQLLDFSRKQSQEPEKHPCQVAAVLDGALDLLKVEVQTADVAVTVAVDEELAPVEANEAQLMQVFVNLVMNALQAMPGGGALDVTADLVERSAYAAAGLPPHTGGELVRIVVRDTGTGIARENLPRVFDPFFTTKPVGKGSGLGLSVSLGIVRGFGGTILVDSDGSSWTEFTVLLPVCEQPALAGVS